MDSVLLGSIGLLVVLGWYVARRSCERRGAPPSDHKTADATGRALRPDRILALLNVSQLVSSEDDLQRVYDHVTASCIEYFNCQQASLMILNESTCELEVRSACGHADLRRVVGARVRVGEGISGWVLEHNEPLVLGNANARGHPEACQPVLAAAVVVPIRVRDRVIGVLNVATRAPIEYTDEDVQVLQVFAANVGSCIRREEQIRWLRDRLASYQKASSGLERSAPERSAQGSGEGERFTS